MPWAPDRPCRAPGCRAKTGHKSGYCQEHRSGHSWGHQGQTASQRGYGYRWQKIRAAMLSQEPRCIICLTVGRVTLAKEIDHIVPRARGGSDKWDNLQPLCKECHKAKTLRERTGETG